MSKTIAEQAFEAKQAQYDADDRLADALTEALGEGSWSDFDYDSYDQSLEVFGVRGDVGISRRAALAHLGFRLIWLHPGETRISCPKRDAWDYCACEPLNYTVS